MEDSLSSYSNGEKDEPTEEESGWTTYFDDFFDSQTRPNDHHQQSSYLDDPSLGATNSSTSCLVSDAASHVEYWKGSNNTLFGSSPKFSKKLNFKKTRTKKIPYDDSLEDTASSPVNSPKVGSLKEVEFNQRKADDTIESSMGKGGGFDHHSEIQKVGLRDDEMVVQGEVKDDRTNLRKKGMCLVPVSMLVNYLG